MIRVAYCLGTHEDWGGGSRALLNFVRAVDKTKIRPLVVLTKEGTLSAELTKQSIEYRILPKKNVSRNVITSAYWIAHAMRFLRKSAVDVLHLNYSSAGWKPPIVLAAKMLGVPVIFHYHSRVPSASSFVRYAAGIVMVSDFIKRHSDTHGRPAYTVHNIVDIQRFGNGKDIREELGIDSDVVVVSFVGQVRLIKGIKTLLDAINTIPDRNVRFLIAGEFRETSDVFTEKKFKREISKDARIVYLGYRSDVQDLYQTSDVVVMPSLYDEPCAMVLFETAAARKPIVASATGGTPEIINDGINGFLFPRDDAVELAKAIEKLVQDADLRATLGARAYEMAIENFSKRPVQLLENIYSDLHKQSRSTH